MNGKRVITDILYELGASILIAAAMYNFALPAQFLMTGFTGIAMIFYRLFDVPIGLTTVALNVPLAIVSFRCIGRGFLWRSLRCIVISSVMIDYIAPLFPQYIGSRMLASLVTGVLAGTGYALIYMRQSSTGGSDFIIMLIRSFRPHLRLSTIAFVWEIGIVLAGSILFRDVDGLVYGLIINYLYAVMVDRVMYGANAGKVGLIVTRDGERICAAIERCSGRGSTILHAAGGYRQEKKQVVMAACSTRQMYAIEQAVRAADPECFMIILNSSEVHGEGFRVIR